MVQQAEEVEALAHLCGVGQHVVAPDQLLAGGWVSAVPQQNLQRTTVEFKAPVVTIFWKIYYCVSEKGVELTCSRVSMPMFFRNIL